jgi:hypothetical protein
MKAHRAKGQQLDCIAMKRAIQKEISAETKGMTPAERLAYYRKLVDEGPFASLLRARRGTLRG